MRLRRVVGLAAAAVLLLGMAAGAVAWFTSTNDCGRLPAEPANPMRAVIYCEFGPPEVLRVQAIAKPVPADSQVLIRVRAAALNPLDWHFMRGTPYLGRIAFGLRKPASIRLGVDFAGVVEAVGPGVTRFRPGDEVYGGRTGALAEYVVMAETGSLARKPANVTFEQAAGVPVAGVTALQGLRDRGRLRAGQRVLINGASGGVGTFAVQLARAMGAEVTGVCSTRNVELVRSLGASRVVDYTRENFARGAERYDVILDNVGNHPLSAMRRVLEPDGRYVMVGGRKGRWIAPMPRALWAAVVSRFVSQDLGMFISDLRAADLDTLRQLIEAGQVTPVVDRVYPLGEIRAAMAYLEQGHARGKVVVTME